MLTIDSDNIAALLTLVVDAMPNRKIEQIKAVRSVLGTGLKESKDLIEAEHARREPCKVVELAIANIWEERRAAAFHRDCSGFPPFNG